MSRPPSLSRFRGFVLRTDHVPLVFCSVAGAFVTSKVSANYWRQRNIEGSLVLIASMSGHIANRGLTCTAYNTSKAAVHQMCRSLAQEWGPEYGIRVNTLSPGVSAPLAKRAGGSETRECELTQRSGLQYIRTAMTDGLLAEKPELKETWMRGAMLNRLGVVRLLLKDPLRLGGDTDALPFSPLQPEDFVGPAVFLLSDASSFMTGADLRVDGGHCASA